MFAWIQNTGFDTKTYVLDMHFQNNCKNSSKAMLQALQVPPITTSEKPLKRGKFVVSVDVRLKA